MRGLRGRFWIEAVVSLAAIVAAIATIVSPTWIELVSGVELDEGEGWLEFAVAAALAGVALGTIFLGAREWRRTTARA
jgi:hypothetical protein